MFLNILIGFLVLCGAVLVVWGFVGLLMKPVFGEDMVTFLFVSGDGHGLEQQVRSYGWYRDGRLSGGSLVLVDNGLSQEGRRIAELLCGRYDWLSLLCQ